MLLISLPTILCPLLVSQALLYQSCISSACSQTLLRSGQICDGTCDSNMHKTVATITSYNGRVHRHIDLCSQSSPQHIVVDRADWGSVTTEDATQNAALAAILFLAGGVGKDSPHCIITLVGSDPTVRPLVLNRKQATKMLEQRVSQVSHAKVSSINMHSHRYIYRRSVPDLE